jgi:hypothetical protein
MKGAFFGLALLAVAAATGAELSSVKDGWSETVNGLRARLVSGERCIPSGEKIPELYLELHNVSDRGLLLEFDYNARTSVRFELKSANGKPVPKYSGVAGSGNRCHDKLHVQLPMDGKLRFPVSCHSIMTSTNFTTIQLDPDAATWVIPATDSQTYLLSGILEVPEPSPEMEKASWPNWRWYGTIMVPPVGIGARP